MSVERREWMELVAELRQELAAARAACESYSRICVSYRIGIPPKDSDLDCVRDYNGKQRAEAAGGAE